FSTIFAISPTYPTYGLFYVSGTPDAIELRWNGVVKRRWNFETGAVEVRPALSGTGIQPRVYRDVAAYTESVSGGLGWLKILCPKGWTNTMLQIRVKGYDYSHHGSWEIVICGYNYATTSTWTNARIEVVHGEPPFHQARLGIDANGKVGIMLGTDDTVWNYPTIIISEVIAGYSQVEDWDDGWVITRTGSLVGFTTKKNVYFSVGPTRLNKIWAPCMFVGQRDPATARQTWDDFSIANKGLTNFATMWELPLPGLDGYGRTLYVDAVKVAVRDADSNDYITKTTVTRVGTTIEYVAQTLTDMNSPK
ncbi:unnamed protein product, partial [marine sediment metagenome]